MTEVGNKSNNIATPLPYNPPKQLRHTVGVVYHPLAVLHVGEAGDMAVGSECFEVTEHVLGYEGFVLAVPIMYVGAADSLQT